MASAKGYVILTEDIHDEAGMAEYGQASFGSLLEHGAKVLVADDQVEVLEGSWHGTRTVVVEFESVDKAREWYHSASYRQALPRREAAATSNVIIANGFTMGGG